MVSPFDFYDDAACAVVIGVHGLEAIFYGPPMPPEVVIIRPLQAFSPLTVS